MKREILLHEMGLGPIWRLRRPGTKADPRASSTETAEFHTPVGETVAAMGWDELERAIADCRACPLCQQRKQAVVGVGDQRPDWLFVGEGPGADEDAKGEPFVGQAGKLLDNMLAAIGLVRGRGVYIGNAVKCRPPGNRTPTIEEIAACRHFLERQIELLQPKLIVALGAVAVQVLLGEHRSLGPLRKKHFNYQGIPLIVSYHPAYYLRNSPDKAKAWEDLCFARQHMAELKMAD